MARKGSGLSYTDGMPRCAQSIATTFSTVPLAESIQRLPVNESCCCTSRDYHGSTLPLSHQGRFSEGRSAMEMEKLCNQSPFDKSALGKSSGGVLCLGGTPFREVRFAFACMSHPQFVFAHCKLRGAAGILYIVQIQKRPFLAAEGT